jgi:hypothetical protein
LNCEERTFASLNQFLKLRNEYKMRHREHRSTA